MARNERRYFQRVLKAENAKQPAELVEIPRERWPDSVTGDTRLRVWRSKAFLVQEFSTSASSPFTAGIVRLSVCRTQMLPNGRWQEGISWDELQTIKNACGYADRDAVEVYPAEGDVVNVANMRHLWVLPFPLQFAWRNGST